MSNKYKDHLLILPEDDANKDLALGFVNSLAKGANAVQIESVAGGWSAARDRLGGLLPSLRRFDKRRVLVLVDFDESGTRREDVLGGVPEALKHRVFVLGVWSEPEALQKALGRRAREAIGEDLARECLGASTAHWGHPLLAHNAGELARLRADVLPFLQ